MTIGHCTGQNISITKFYWLLLLWRFLHSLVWFLGWSDLEVGLSWDPGPLLYLACLLPAWQLERERLEMGGNRKKGFERNRKGSSDLYWKPAPHPLSLCPIRQIRNVSLKPAQVQGGGESQAEQSRYRSTHGIWVHWENKTSKWVGACSC